MNSLPQETTINDITVRWLARYDGYRGWYGVSESNLLITMRHDSLEALQEAVRAKLLTKGLA